MPSCTVCGNELIEYRLEGDSKLLQYKHSEYDVVSCPFNNLTHAHYVFAEQLSHYGFDYESCVVEEQLGKRKNKDYIFYAYYNFIVKSPYDDSEIKLIVSSITDESTVCIHNNGFGNKMIALRNRKFDGLVYFIIYGPKDYMDNRRILNASRTTKTYAKSFRNYLIGESITDLMFVKGDRSTNKRGLRGTPLIESVSIERLYSPVKVRKGLVELI